MSAGHIGKRTNHPDTSGGARVQAEREDQWGAMPGRIVSFDAETQTATVQPLFKPRHNGEPVDMPELQEVPVRFLRAGGFVITTPVKVGDKVELRPQARSTANYHTGTGDAFAPADSGSFSLSDMEAHLIGGESLGEPIPNFNASNMEIRSADGAFRVEMSEDGKFKLVGAQGEVFDLIATLCELLADETLDHAIDYAALAVQIRGMIA